MPKLENRLDEILDAIINRRRTACVPAERIATLTAKQQASALRRLPQKASDIYRKITS